MSTKKEDLSEGQVTAALLLFGGNKPGEVAKAVGVHPSQISKWKHKPAFKAYLQELTQEAREQAMQIVTGLGKAAADRLRKIINDDTADPFAQLKAIGMVFQIMGVIGKTVSVEVSGPGGGPVGVDTDNEARAAIQRFLSGERQEPESREIIDVELEPQETE